MCALWRPFVALAFFEAWTLAQHQRSRHAVNTFVAVQRSNRLDEPDPMDTTATLVCGRALLLDTVRAQRQSDVVGWRQELSGCARRRKSKATRTVNAA